MDPSQAPIPSPNQKSHSEEILRGRAKSASRAVIAIQRGLMVTGTALSKHPLAFARGLVDVRWGCQNLGFQKLTFKPAPARSAPTTGKSEAFASEESESTHTSTPLVARTAPAERNTMLMSCW